MCILNICHPHVAAHVPVLQKLKPATANNNRREIIFQKKAFPKQRLNIVIYICLNKSYTYFHVIFGNSLLINNVHAHIYIFPSWCSFFALFFIFFYAILVLANRELLPKAYAQGDVYVSPLFCLWVRAKSTFYSEEKYHAFEQVVHCCCRKTTIMVTVPPSACIFS